MPLAIFLVGLSAFLTSGCVYQFTNKHVVRPEGIRTIAVEAIFDSSREVLPHEVLWESLQAAIAEDGKLRLVGQGQADALLRAHLKDASVMPDGSVSLNLPDKDPKFRGKMPPPAPAKFRRLEQAGQVRASSKIALVLDVEIWNLRTGSLLMKKTYSGQRGFRSIHADQKRTVTTKENDHLRYEEALEAKMKSLGDDFSRQILRDLLVR